MPPLAAAERSSLHIHGAPHISPNQTPKPPQRSNLWKRFNRGLQRIALHCGAEIPA